MTIPDICPGHGEASMKLCKDCRFAYRTFWQIIFRLNPYTFARCQHPLSKETSEPDVVDNSIETKNRFCSVMRCKGQSCGIEARLFEARK